MNEHIDFNINFNGTKGTVFYSNGTIERFYCHPNNRFTLLEYYVMKDIREYKAYRESNPYLFEAIINQIPFNFIGE